MEPFASSSEFAGPTRALAAGHTGWSVSAPAPAELLTVPEEPALTVPDGPALTVPDGPALADAQPAFDRVSPSMAVP